MEKELATSPPRRRVHSEVLRANEHRIEVLRQELGEERHTEETQEVRWQREETGRQTMEAPVIQNQCYHMISGFFCCL